jgi:hypothetical protein
MAMRPSGVLRAAAREPLKNDVMSLRLREAPMRSSSRSPPLSFDWGPAKSARNSIQARRWGVQRAEAKPP